MQVDFLALAVALLVGGSVFLAGCWLIGRGIREVAAGASARRQLTD